MSVGRISGPLLKDNLLRNGANLAFETNLLYLDVVNSRIGISNANPAYQLDVTGTSRTTSLLATTATVNEVYISTNIVRSTFGNLNLTANSGQSIVVGTVGQNNDVLINGSLHATGGFTVDGNTIVGTNGTNTVAFNSSVSTSFIPNDSTHDLGSSTKVWANIYSNSLHTTSLASGNIQISGNTILATNTDGVITLTPNGVGNVNVNSTLASTAYNNGSLVVGGGVGIAGAIFANSTLSVAGHVTLEGVTSTGATGTGKLVFATSPSISDPTVTGHITVEGVTSTGATGTGKLVFDNTPTIVTPTISGHFTAEGVTTTGATGTGKLVFDGSPTLVTPTLGVASATTINKVTITSPATRSTLTIADGKTLTASNTLTFTGTDGSSVAFSSGGTVTYTSNKLSVFSATTSAELAGVLSDETGFSTGALAVFSKSPSIDAPTITGHPVVEGVTSTGATGTGNFVFSASPTFTGTVTLPAITATNITNSALTSGRVVYSTTAGLETDSANLTFNGTTLTANALAVTAGATVGTTLDVTGLSTLATAKVSNLTSGRVVLAGASGTIQDSGNLTFSGTKLTVTGDQDITGNLKVDGNISLGGNITIGDNVLDTVTVTADFTSDLIPQATNTYNLGSSSYRWKKLFANALDVSDTTVLGNLQLSGNTIQATNTDGGLTLTANGTGYVSVSGSGAFLIPAGNTAGRPGTPAVGMIRYNNQLTQFEGYSSGNWSSLGGVRSVDGNAYIIAETSPGAADDTLYFWAGAITSTNVGNWTDTALTILSPGFRVPTGDTAHRPTGVDGYIRFNTQINKFEGYSNSNWSSLGGVSSVDGTTYIGATNTELDFYVNSVLKGTVTSNGFNLGNIRITSNTVSATNTNGNVNLTADGTGVVAVTGVGALRIPAGTTAEQPGASVGSVTGDAGWIRYNTDLRALELWSQASSAYVPVTGSSSAAGDTYISFETNGNDEKIIRFFVGNGLPHDPTSGSTEIAYISKDGFFVDGTTIKTQIANGTIQTATTDTDLTLKSNGNGTVIVDDSFEVTGHVKLEGVTSTGATGTGKIMFNDAPTITGHPTIEGVTATGATGTGNFVFDTSPTINNLTVDNTLTLGTTIFYDHGVDGFSVNENFDIASGTNFTGYHFTSGTGRDGVAFTLARSDQFTNGFGVNGTSVSNEFVIGSEVGNTSFVFKNSIGMPFDVSGGNALFTIDPSGHITVEGVTSTGATGTGNIMFSTSPTIEGHPTIEGVTSTGATGTGNFVFSTSPTFTGTVVADAITANSLNGTPIGGASPSTGAFTTLTSNSLVVNGRISIHDNVIENTYTNDDLIIRANGTGRVIIDGSGTSANSGNVFATDPLLTFNSGLSGTANTYDAGFIINRGTNPNVGLVWSESAGEFRAISTLEQGTVKGSVSVTAYQNVSTNTVKLNSETATKLAFVDSSKYVRSLDTGRSAVVDGTLTFNSAAQLNLPTGSNSQRPGSATTGSVRYNTDSQIFEGYGTAGWQAMGVGVGTGVDYQSFTGDGTTYQFTLQQTPLGAGSIMVVVNGIVQQPGISYQVVNNILSFADTNGNTFAPEISDSIDVRFLSKPSVSSVREYNYTGDGSNTTFAVDFTINSVAEVMVFVNNIYQDSAVYTYSGTNVIFTQAPFSNERVCIVHLCAIIAPNVPTVQSAQDDAIAFSIALG